ncbi:MAG: ribose-phosphate diphosphokinase [Patescibacteria group bacterium]
MADRMMVFATGSGRVLAEKICGHLSVNLGDALVGRFGDGEVRVEIKQNVRGADLYIVGSLCPPAENWIEMMLLCEAARYSSAERITLVPTYLGYNRQDRKDKPRVPISAHVMMDMLKHRGADRALLFDLHSEQTAAHFHPQMVTDHLYGSIVAVPYLRTILSGDYVVAAPDNGAVPRASKYLELLNNGEASLVICDKRRKNAGAVEKVNIIGDVAGKHVLIVDDIIDSGGTLIANAKAAKDAGAKDMYAFATHALFSKGAAIFDDSPFSEIIVTDSIPHTPERLETKRVKVTVLSLAPKVAEAIRRTHDGQSLSEMITART